MGQNFFENLSSINQTNLINNILTFSNYQYFAGEKIGWKYSINTLLPRCYLICNFVVSSSTLMYVSVLFSLYVFLCSLSFYFFSNFSAFSFHFYFSVYVQNELCRWNVVVSAIAFNMEILYHCTLYSNMLKCTNGLMKAVIHVHVFLVNLFLW